MEVVNEIRGIVAAHVFQSEFLSGVAGGGGLEFHHLSLLLLLLLLPWGHVDVVAAPLVMQWEQIESGKHKFILLYVLVLPTFSQIGRGGATDKELPTILRKREFLPFSTKLAIFRFLRFSRRRDTKGDVWDK